MTNRWRPARLPAWLAVPLLLSSLLWAGFLAREHLHGAGILDRAETALVDARLVSAGTRQAPSSIVVVAIDDATVAAEGAYPLARERLAELVDRIRASGAKALAIDVLLVDRGEPGKDARLAGALADIPHVLAAAGTFEPASDETRAAIPSTASELWPNDAFFDPNAIGLVNVATDATGAPRFFPLVFETSRGLMPAFVLRAAALLAGIDPVLSANEVRIGTHRVPLDLGRHMPVRSLGPTGTVPTLSARDVLAGSLAPDRLANTLVLIGVTATAVGDTFGTAFDPVLPGVELLATGIATLSGGAGLQRDPVVRRADAAIALAAATGGAALFAYAPLLIATIASGLALLVWVAAVFVLFGHGVWLNMAMPLAAFLLPALVVVSARHLVQRRSVARLARLEDEFRRFQPPLLAERLRRDPAFLAQPVEQQAAIVFVDLAGFTRYAERLGSRRLHDFLAHYHSMLESISADHGGMVMNFMGDGAMILFGVPEPGAEDAGRAFRAAFALRRAVEGWLAVLESGKSELGVRIGAHAGSVTLSRLGHEAHRQITVSGDNVNLAARLLEVAKAQRAVLVVSRQVLDASRAVVGGMPAPDGRFNTAIRGRREMQDIAFWR